MTGTQFPINIDDRLYQAIAKLSEQQKEDLLEFIRKLPFEKRILQRKKYFAEVSYADHSRSANGFIQNISDSGFYIEPNGPFPLYQKLTFTFDHPSLNKHIKVSGEIVRRDQKGMGVRLSESI